MSEATVERTTAVVVDEDELSTAPELCAVPRFDEAVIARLRRSAPAEEAVEEARELFAALADRNRIRVLQALSEAPELCVCDVAHVLGVSVSAASHHLRRLRDVGLLRRRNDGRMVYYALRDRFAAEMVGRALGRAGES